MAEYIDREAAVKIAEKFGLSNGTVLGRHTGIADYIASEIAELPPADVVPVRHGQFEKGDILQNVHAGKISPHRYVVFLKYGTQYDRKTCDCIAFDGARIRFYQEVPGFEVVGHIDNVYAIFSALKGARSRISKTGDEWVPVAEKTPTAFLSVLGYMTDAGPFPPVRECYSVGRNDNQFYFPALGEFHPVSHWKPMPEPPEVTSHEKE